MKSPTLALQEWGTGPPSARKNKGELMKRVLLLGYDPETVDFSDPALPPGMTVEKVHAGIAVAMKQFAERGWEADLGFIRPERVCATMRLSGKFCVELRAETFRTRMA